MVNASSRDDANTHRPPRLVLINPVNPRAGVFSTHLPPLNLAYLAAYTPASWQVTLIDENIRPHPRLPARADLAGITTITSQATRAYELAALYRRAGVPVVLGGIHASMAPDEALRHADAVVVGEADRLWPRVLEDFSRGDLQSVYRNRSHPSLERMPLPRRDLFSPAYPADVLQTARGCPFDCEFCSVTAFHGRKVRYRPVAEVVAELRTIRKTFVIFADDNIIGSGAEGRSRARDLFDAMIAAGIKKHWISQASVNVADDPELLRLMKRSGCLGLLMGFESILEDPLRRYGKKQNLAAGPPAAYYEHVVRVLNDHRIGVGGYFCFGEEDTAETFARMRVYLKRTGMNVINTPLLTPLPGTKFYRRMAGRIECRDFPRDWDRFLCRLVYTPSRLSKPEFYREYDRLTREVNSFRQILRRTWNVLAISKNLFYGLVCLVLNMYFRRSKARGLAYLRREDPDYPAARRRE